MVFVLLVSVLYSRTPSLPYIGRWYWWVGGIKKGSASTTSANEPAKYLILVHTVQLKQMITAQISGRMVSSDISDVAIASVHSEKTRLK